jgi:voltage-gated potassium channel
MPTTLLRQRLYIPLLLVLATLLVGTLGFWLIWREYNASWMDAFYMTAITITTIGYGEIHQLTTVGRLWAVVVAFVGIASLFYSFSVVMDFLVARQFAISRGETLQHKIDHLKDHVILAGFGRVGRQAALELKEAKVPFVIVDTQGTAKDFAEGHNFLYFEGDASKDEVLEKVGIKRAMGIIVTTGSDASNTYIVLSARVLNPGLQIVSRAVDEDSVSKLLRAGADRAISPYAIGGRRLAHLLLSPTVVDFFDTVLKKGDESLNLEDILISPQSAAIGQSLDSLLQRCPASEGKTRISVLVVFRGNEAIANPRTDLILQAHDRILAMGTSVQLDRLEGLVKH